MTAAATPSSVQVDVVTAPFRVEEGERHRIVDSTGIVVATSDDRAYAYLVALALESVVGLKTTNHRTLETPHPMGGGPIRVMLPRQPDDAPPTYNFITVGIVRRLLDKLENVMAGARCDCPKCKPSKEKAN